MEILAFLFVAGCAVAVILAAGLMLKLTFHLLAIPFTLLGGLLKGAIGLTVGLTLGLAGLVLGAMLLPVGAVVLACLVVVAMIAAVIWAGCALLGAAF